MGLARKPSSGIRLSLRLVFACLLLLGAVLPCLALSVPRNPRFLQLGVPQGLPQDTALAMVQDRQGFIWIGTQVGLARFDGYQVTAYRHDPIDPESLIDNYVKALYEDSKGRLWIGTRGGLVEYDPLRDGFRPHLPP